MWAYYSSFSRVIKWLCCAPVGGMRIWPLLLELSLSLSPTPTLCLLLVLQQIIHVLSGRLHLANAALLPPPAATSSASVPLCKVHCKYWQADSKRQTTTLSEKGRKSRRWRGWWDDGGRTREVLPPPKATECALMRCGREHTVSPQSAREQPHTHTHTRVFTLPPHYFLKCQNIRAHSHTHTHLHTCPFTPSTLVHGGFCRVNSSELKYRQQPQIRTNISDLRASKKLRLKPSNADAKFPQHFLHLLLPSVPPPLSRSAAAVVCSGTIHRIWFMLRRWELRVETKTMVAVSGLQSPEH